MRMVSAETEDKCFAQNEEFATLHGLSRRIAQLESDKTKRSNAYNNAHESPNGQMRNSFGKNKGRCYICQSPNHYFSKCPIYIKCKEEINRKSSNKEFKADDHKGGSSHKNQGNFDAPLTH